MNKGHQGKASRRRAERSKRNGKKRRIQQIKMERGCVDCDYNAHPAALGFDHIRGTKLFNVGSYNMTARSWPVILAEIEKCEVRYANCHSINFQAE